MHIRPSHYPGRGSGRFLGRLHALLNGADNFYETIFTELGMSYLPVKLQDNVSGAAQPAARRVILQVIRIRKLPLHT